MGRLRQIEGWHKPIGLVRSRFFYQPKILRAKNGHATTNSHGIWFFLPFWRRRNHLSSTFLFVFPFFCQRGKLDWCYGGVFLCLKSHGFIESPLTFSKGYLSKSPKSPVRYTTHVIRIWGPKRWIQVFFCSQKQRNKNMRSKNRTSF